MVQAMQAGTGEGQSTGQNPGQNPGQNTGDFPQYGDPFSAGAQAAPPPYASQPPQIPVRGGGVTSVLGAVLSLGLLVGLGVWGYKLAVRDVSGVPIVRAIDGPMRIQPDDPGGESAAYQGFSVNVVQSRGGVEAPADMLALAPRTIGVAPGDAPVTATTQVAPLDGSGPAIAATGSAPARPAPTNSAPVLDETADAATQMLALVEQLTEDVPPLSGTLREVTPTSSAGVVTTQVAANNAVAAAILNEQIIPVSVPGVARSPRPNHRPANLVITRAATPSSTSSTGAAPASSQSNPTREIAAADIPIGTRLVQLGAFESADVARGEWTRLMEDFEDYMIGKARVIQQASSGGKTFYRLRAHGFADLEDTRRFCAVLIAANAQCIPVMTR